MRRNALHLLLPVAIVLLATGFAIAESTHPNILFISVDDMSCDSVGAFGCVLPDTTPNIDRLAKQGLRFQYAHVCTNTSTPSPSR